MENLHVRKLELTQFKNHRHSVWQFNPKVNIITGNNGNGKTNVLDALHFLSFTKSYLGSTDAACITHGEQMALIKAEAERKELTTTIDIGLKRGQKKMIQVDGKAAEKLSEHIGYLPVVMITPSDRDLILDAAEVRRKLMDSTVSQNNRTYMNALMGYNKALTQRNTTLKYFASNRTFDGDMLDLYNEQLIIHSEVIHNGRKEYVKELVPVLQRYYDLLSGGREAVSIAYKSALLEQDMKSLLAENLERDKVLQYTSGGLHRDDLIFKLGTHPIKRLGSQGQQKSFLIALKLAQFELTQRHLGMSPLLLLDDIFDKLDESRVANLLSLVNTEKFGQIFITDTHSDRMLELSTHLQLNHTTFKVLDNGEIQIL